MPFYRYIISIDIGIKHFAWTTFDKKHELITDWNICNLNLESESPLATAEALKALIPMILASYPNDRCLVLVEKQPPNGYQIVEGQVHALAPASYVMTPTAVGHFRDTIIDKSETPGRPSRAIRYKTRKANALKLVEGWIREKKLKFLHEKIVDIFKTATKKDDLADSMVQLFAFLEFGKNKDKWLRKFISQSSGDEAI